MSGVVFWCGWLALAAGFALGLSRRWRLLVQVATAGAAALAVSGAQAAGLVPFAPPSLATLEWEALLYAEAVALAALGCGLGLWHRKREGE